MKSKVLTEVQLEKILQTIAENIIKAEQNWNRSKGKMVATREHFAMDSALRESVEPSNIPGHPLVRETAEVSTFIAFVIDIRGSSSHLLQARKGFDSEIQRVYYETSALLPAIAQTLQFFDGCVTEYLGDGLLAFFQVEEDWSPSISNSYQAAKAALYDTLPLVNLVLKEKYNLPELQVGIGLSLGPAMVTLVGLEREKLPKAIGRCVYEATKLSAGVNEIVINEFMYKGWKKSKGGKMRFKPKNYSGVDGYTPYTST